MWIFRDSILLCVLASFAAGKPPLSIASMDFRLIDFDTAAAKHRLETLPLSQLTMDLVFAPKYYGVEAGLDGSKNNECRIPPDQSWTAEGWAYCSSSTIYVRIKRRTGADKFEMELEVVHFEFDSTQKYPDAKLNVHHLRTTLAANATDQAQNDLACEWRRQNKDVMCKTSLLRKPHPIPLFIRHSTSVQLERLHVRNLTFPPLRLIPHPSDMGEAEGNMSVRVPSPTRAFVIWDLFGRVSGTQDNSSGNSSSSVADVKPARDGEAECAGTYQCGEPYEHRRNCYGKLKCPGRYDGDFDFRSDAAGRPDPLFLTRVGYTFGMGVGSISLQWTNMLFYLEKENRPSCEPDCGKCGEKGCVWEKESGRVIGSIDFRA